MTGTSAGGAASGNGGVTSGAGGSPGVAGFAAVSGGASGAAGLGAHAGNGGRAHTGSGGSASGPPPATWTCAPAQYGDGQACDCGCGAADPDCIDATVAACDNCHVLGGCGHASCPANIDPGENSKCRSPRGWLCDATAYGDNVCDCGCGAIDIDCPGQTSDLCKFCPLEGCTIRFDCSTIDPDENALCTSPPSSWTCDPRLYRDGTRCDCGCGYPDPDCATNDTLGVCDTCDAEGSCSHQPCPGLIDPNQNSVCDHPTPPSTWMCGDYSYGDGKSCDCGCGAQDPDCRENTPDDCDRCNCGPRCSSVDATDPRRCAPPPPTWTCPAAIYADGNCDCGCGVIDADCAGSSESYCETCDQGCAMNRCDAISQVDNSQCDYTPPSGWNCTQDQYWDDVCDCGCGLVDRGCQSTDKSACKICNDAGSCSTLPCKDPQSKIKATDNGSCSP
jgi:hypothetical protein